MIWWLINVEAEPFCSFRFEMRYPREASPSWSLTLWLLTILLVCFHEDCLRLIYERCPLGGV